VSAATGEGAERLRARAEALGQGTLRLRAGVGSAVGESVLVVDPGALFLVTRRSYLEPFELHRGLEGARVEREARGETFVARSGSEELRIALGYGEAEAVEALLATHVAPRERVEVERPDVDDGLGSGGAGGDEARAEDERRALDDARVALLTLLDRPRVMLAWLEGRSVALAQRRASPWDEAVALARDTRRARPHPEAPVRPRREPLARAKAAKHERPASPNRKREDVVPPPTSVDHDAPQTDEASLVWLYGVMAAIVFGGWLLSLVLR